MADYESGGSEIAIAGAEQSLGALTPQDFMALPPKPTRPDWMLTRYPVDMAEFERLNRAAEQIDPQPQPALHDTGDQGLLLARGVELDVPEDALAGPPAGLAPPMPVSFEGIPATAWRPPDNTCAVGPNNVLLAVNTDLAGYSRSGGFQFRWANMTTLFNKVLPAGAQLFDPRVAYDHYQQRWIVVVAARRESPAGSWLMVAVSQGPQPDGAFWVWALDAMLDGNRATNNWADYPMLGFDTQAIYIVSNMFQINGGFQYSKLRILNKSELYAGGVGPNHNIRWYDFWNLRNPDNSIAFTVQPCTHFTGIGGNPPAYLVNVLWPQGNSLTLWTLNNPIGYWQGQQSTLTRDPITCRSYDLPPDAEQPGTNVRIETNDSRLLNAIYQSVSNTRRIWTCHTVKQSWAGDSAARSAVQWYEIDVPGKSVVQQNAYGASGQYYYFPAIQTDMRRNAYLVFGRSNQNEFASLRQTGRLADAPANELLGSALIKAGLSSYTGQRWGDYFGICRDPANPNFVWVYGEYAEARGNWGTWVAELGF